MTIAMTEMCWDDTTGVLQCVAVKCSERTGRESGGVGSDGF